MSLIKQLAKDWAIFEIFHNETWERKIIWKEKDFIEYISFFSWETIGIEKAVKYFNNNISWGEVWVWLELFII